jgi:hypothetical protein
VYPLFLTAAMGGVAFLSAFLQKRMKLLASNLIFVMPVVAGLTYWMLTAPDPRFAHSLFYLLALSVTVVAVLCAPYLESSHITNGRVLGIVVLFLCFLIGRRIPLHSPLVSSYADFPKPSLVERTTNSGLRIYVPEADSLCWDSPLPCTPDLNPKLKLRRGNELPSGFTVR